MDKHFNDEMIKENYDEIIEGLILNYDYVNEKYAISLIREILECGVNSLDISKIQDICMKVADIKTLKDSGHYSKYNNFNFSSNKAIIKEAIKLYDEKFEDSPYDVDMDILDEFVADQIHHSR